MIVMSTHVTQTFAVNCLFLACFVLTQLSPLWLCRFGSSPKPRKKFSLSSWRAGEMWRWATWRNSSAELWLFFKQLVSDVGFFQQLVSYGSFSSLYQMYGSFSSLFPTYGSFSSLYQMQTLLFVGTTLCNYFDVLTTLCMYELISLRVVCPSWLARVVCTSWSLLDL